jgi:predicted type IV restriction endonuclease
MYIKNLSSNQCIFGIYDGRKHLANFKITIKEKVAEIGFLVFLKHRGKKLIYKNFEKIKNLYLLKKNKIKYLILGVDKKNKRAINLYKNLGFKFKRDSNKIMNYKL